MDFVAKARASARAVHTTQASLRPSLNARASATPLLTACLEASAAGIKSGLDVDDSELAVFDFPVRRHHPHKVDRMAGHRNVGMKPLRHHDGIAISDYTDKFRFFGACVNELNTERRGGHVVVDVQLL